MSTKEKIIKILEENRGRPVSGQMLSQTIGVSRAAVNKAVNSLRISGFSIAASAGSGYVLSEKSDMISAPAIRAGLNDELQELPLFVYASVTSTNDTAKNMAGSAAFINAAGNAAVITIKFFSVCTYAHSKCECFSYKSGKYLFNRNPIQPYLLLP